ncbi:MAG: SRPBCC domain-containing protein [Solirubrobacteraceae bacterium]|nr:SRPBCC domain-containing protein [Solirubrobacteraceae bacterium]
MTTTTQPGTTTYEEVGDRGLVITRVFAAPASAVFAAWTDPAHLPNWLGPAKHAMTVCEIDLRVGGGYRYEWQLAGGGALRMHGTYTEVDAPHRLVSTEIMDDFPGQSVNEMDLVEEEGVTICRCTVTYDTPESRAGALGSGMKGGIDEGYDRLDAIFAAG